MHQPQTDEYGQPVDTSYLLPETGWRAAGTTTTTWPAPIPLPAGTWQMANQVRQQFGTMGGPGVPGQAVAGQAAAPMMLQYGASAIPRSTQAVSSTRVGDPVDSAHARPPVAPSRAQLAPHSWSGEAEQTMAVSYIETGQNVHVTQLPTATTEEAFNNRSGGTGHAVSVTYLSLIHI